MTDSQTKKARFARASSVDMVSVSTAMAAMLMIPAAAHGPVRLQLNIGNAGRDVQPGLALHADRLQRIGILRTADKEITAEADTDRRIGADAAVTAGKFAAADTADRRIDGPGQPNLIGEAEVDAVAADGCDIGLRP